MPVVMEAAHSIIGVLATIALIITISHKASQVVVNISEPICELSARRLPTTLLESERLHDSLLRAKYVAKCLYAVIENFALAESEIKQDNKHNN